MDFLKEGMTEKGGRSLSIHQPQYNVEAEPVRMCPLRPSSLSFGANARRTPHQHAGRHSPEGRRLHRDSDIGGRKQRYCSDMTCTYFSASRRTRQYAAIHDLGAPGQRSRRGAG
ncbi:MAG: hypothetical protein ACLU9S_03590 [Oscillospiraceae bacterium]